MPRSLLYLLKLFLFWEIFFSLHRLSFILIYTDKIPEGMFSESLLSFFYSFKLDLSSIAYLMAVPAFLWGIQQFVKKNILNRMNHFFNLALISLVTVLCISNIAMYGEWDALINYNTLIYLTKPALMFPYLSTLQMIGVFIGTAAIISLFVLLFRVMMLMVIPYSTSKMQLKICVISFILPAMFIVMRGGFQQMPVNESSACFSESQFINHAAINPVWHLGHMTLLAWKEPEEKK